ncbi:GOLPH3/VPS74 family protein [Streptomyces nitrosporeus]|uniref:GOLPH3/VPS74 family protein n=1 Tax=Streptomyces nitrosporeus TaxID=28894 RepID=UPI0039A37060
MNGPAPSLTLPEELLLLALDPVRGKPRCRNRNLEYGIAGAALAELELRGHIRAEGGRVHVVGPLCASDPLLAVLLRTLPAADERRFFSGTSAKGWVRKNAGQAGGLYLDALVGRGVLRRESRRFIGLFPYHRHPAADGDFTARVRQRFPAALAAAPTDLRDRLLVALAAAVELPAALNTGDRPARAAMRSLTKEIWQADAVRRNVAQDKSSAGGGGGGGGGSGGDGGGE